MRQKAELKGNFLAFQQLILPGRSDLITIIKELRHNLIMYRVDIILVLDFNLLVAWVVGL
jgi:hypothetical protein